MRAPCTIERPIIERLIAKPERKAFFRRAVLQAYEERCAVTGWKLINGGGRESICLRPQTPGASHPARLASAYRPARVRACGPLVADRTSACQRRGRQVNDRASVEAIVNRKAARSRRSGSRCGRIRRSSPGIARTASSNSQHSGSPGSGRG
jgi:putative restriction endonuclease